MSTRSFIGLLNKDGSVRCIYHHFDGGLNYVGKMLVRCYKDENRINQLLDLGDMSIIGPEPIGFWSDGEVEDKDRCKCRTYRERGETNVDAKTYKSVQDFLETCDEDYTYLFMNGDWFYRKWSEKDLKLVKDDIQ